MCQGYVAPKYNGQGKKLVMIQYTKENTHRICSFILKATRRHEKTASQPERGTRTFNRLHNVLGGKGGSEKLSDLHDTTPQVGHSQLAFSILLEKFI